MIFIDFFFRSSEGIVNVDEEDLCTVIYNTLFNQILVVKALGTFKIYQAETGEIVRQFMVRPVDPMTTKPIPPTKDKATGLFLPLVLHACLDKVRPLNSFFFFALINCSFA